MQSTYALRTIIALSPSGSFAAVAYIVPESPTEFLHFVIFLSLPRGSRGWETSACFSAKSDQLRPYAYIRVRIPWLPPRLPLETVLSYSYDYYFSCNCVSGDYFLSRLRQSKAWCADNYNISLIITDKCFVLTHFYSHESYCAILRSTEISSLFVIYLAKKACLTLRAKHRKRYITARAQIELYNIILMKANCNKIIDRGFLPHLLGNDEWGFVKAPPSGWASSLIVST